MGNPIRPKDVAREYMYRFVHFVPDVRGYQRFYNATQYAAGFERNSNYKQFKPGTQVSTDICIDRFIVDSCGIAGYIAMMGGRCLLPDAVEMLPTLIAGDATGHRHRTLMACPSLVGFVRGVYCFDTFAIDNSYGENGNVLWARYQFTAKWAALTDLGALSQ